MKNPRYTYVIGPVSWGSVKIGRSTDIKGRLNSLRVCSPANLEVLWLIPIDIERELHRHFIDRRGRGEWFALSRTDFIRGFMRLGSTSEGTLDPGAAMHCLTTAGAGLGALPSRHKPRRRKRRPPAVTL